MKKPNIIVPATEDPDADPINTHRSLAKTEKHGNRQRAIKPSRETLGFTIHSEKSRGMDRDFKERWKRFCQVNGLSCYED